MVRYSDWINATGVYGAMGNAAARLFGGHAVIVREDPPIVTNEDAAIVFDEASGDLSENAESGTVSLSYAHPSIFQARMDASVGRLVYDLNLPFGGGWTFYPPGWLPIPDGAIGLHFEGVEYDPDNPFPSGPAEAAGLILEETTMIRSPRVEDESNPSGDLSSSWSSQVMFLPPGASSPIGIAEVAGHTEFSSEIARPLGERIDLTPLLPDPTSPGGSIWMDTPTFVPFTSTEAGFASLHYGWMFSSTTDPNFTVPLAPAPFRWVYDSPSTAPPRRIYPRDDGMTGGARRTWPPSKSQQWGNRVDGSGYV